MKVGLKSARPRFRLKSFNMLEAAVAYDLARCALYGEEYSANLPPHLYCPEDITVRKTHIQARHNPIFTAALMGSTYHPPQKYQTRAAGRAADAAVEAAIRGAGLSESDVQQRKMAGCWEDPKVRSSYIVTMQQTVTSLVSELEASSQIRHRRSYNSLLEAAVAYDMMRQAGRSAVNFPAEVTAAGVPVMKKWLDLNRHRLTVEKQHWKEMAAAAAATDSDDMQGTVGTRDSVGRTSSTQQLPLQQSADSAATAIGSG